MNDPSKLLSLALKLAPLLPCRRALIVEDNDDDAMLLARHIEALGWEAVATHSPKAALRLLEEDAKFSVAFVDIAFPGQMSGFQLADEMKAHRRWRNIEVTYVTGSGENLATASSKKHWSFIIKDGTGSASLEAVQSVLRNGSVAAQESFVTGLVIAMACTLFGYKLDVVVELLKHLL
jgi:CheY-like chemotaxis protein